MIVVDSSIWADHFRRPLEHLLELAEREKLVHHPFVTGELALGNSKQPEALIRSFAVLRRCASVSHEEVLSYLIEHELSGTGVGYVDAHLLASCSKEQHGLWTRDKRLETQAERLGLLYRPE